MGRSFKIFKSSNCKELLAVDPASIYLKIIKLKMLANILLIKILRMILKDYGKFDTIVANNVLANIDDLDDIFVVLKILSIYLRTFSG